MDNSIIESFIRKQKVAFICSVDEEELAECLGELFPKERKAL